LATEIVFSVANQEAGNTYMGQRRVETSRKAKHVDDVGCQVRPVRAELVPPGLAPPHRYDDRGLHAMFPEKGDEAADL